MEAAAAALASVGGDGKDDMSVADPQPAEPKLSIRWSHLTPDRLILALLLIVETLLWLSEHFGWLAWHKGYAVLTAVAAVGMVLLLTLLRFVVALLFRQSGKNTLHPTKR
jgi:hypothetical protein